MAEIINLRRNPHDEVQELLPWLVNGTLAPEEAEKVEGHLADCADCRAELESERKLAAVFAGIPLDTESGWERMQALMTAKEEAPVQPRRGLWHRRVPVGWAVVSPLAAAAAVGLVFINVTPNRPAEPQYRALGATASATPANLVVQFAPATSVSDMQTLLASVDARLVDGPTSTGAYLLHVDQANREIALKELRDNQAIALAEPIDGPPRE